MSEANILVVDDEPAVCELIAEGLAQEGEWTVDYTTEPLRALEQLGQGRYDVIVTDLCMPDMDGLELARQARSLRPEVGVVAITGHASLSSSVAALREGFADYIQKPFRVDEVRQAVHRVVSRRGAQVGLELATDEVTHDNACLSARNEELQQKLELVSRELTLLEHSVASRVTQMEARCEGADALTGLRDADQVLGLGLVLLRKILPGDEHAIIALRRKPTRWIAAAKIESEEVVIGWSERRLSRGVIRAVCKRRQPALIEDASRSEAVAELGNWIGQEGSVLIVPLEGLDGVAGLGVIRRGPESPAFTPAEVLRAMSLCGEIGRTLETSVAFRVQQAQVCGALRAMVEALEESCGQEGHSRRVARLARRVARRLDMDVDRANTIETAGRLHDIGKISLPRDLLSQAGPQSEADQALLATHGVRGVQMLRPIKFLGPVAELVRRHHELGATDEPLSPEAQVLAAVELFDELTHDGPHGPELTPEAALARIFEAYGATLDSRILKAIAAATAADE